MLRAILDEATTSGAAPGGVLLVGDRGNRRHHIAFGVTRLEPAGSGEPVTPDTLFDVASLTKPTVTTAALVKLVGAGAIDLDDRVRRWIPELTSEGTDDLRLRDLLWHCSGLPAHIKFYERVLAGDLAGARTPREAILRMAATSPLAYAPRTDTLYSDLGFILLGFAIERAAGERLDRVAQRLVFDSLAMTRARFVDLATADRPAPVAATERCPYRGLVVGEVHDQNTHAAGGILGQAGLFCTADDLGRFAQAMIDASGGFTPELLELFAAPSTVPGSTRRLGWDSPSAVPGESHAGDLWPRDSLGHLGFTGCAMWIHRAGGRYVVLLTNSIHPQVQKPVTKALRRRVMDAVARELYGER